MSIIQQINALDLDKTLISYDSFRTYISLTLTHPSIYTFFIIIVLILRVLRLINIKTFFGLVVSTHRKFPHYDVCMQHLADKLFFDMSPELLEIINKHTDATTLNIIVTSSPVDYVQKLAAKLGWKYIASDIISGKISYVRGIDKVARIKEEYPDNIYTYNLAISDSLIDQPMLDLFKLHMLYRKSK